MPLEDWVQHSRHDRFLYDWQTLIAGFFAVAAAAGTIWATIRSANREIEASQKQTAVAQKQIETTIRLERLRRAREGYAYCASIWGAMERVLLETSEAESIFQTAGPSDVQEKKPVSIFPRAALRNCEPPPSDTEAALHAVFLNLKETSTFLLRNWTSGLE